MEIDKLYQQLIELDDYLEEFDSVILRSHEKAAMLSKKGVKVKVPVWKGLVAS